MGGGGLRDGVGENEVAGGGEGVDLRLGEHAGILAGLRDARYRYFRLLRFVDLEVAAGLRSLGGDRGSPRAPSK